jgi:hypothetical protein
MSSRRGENHAGAAAAAVRGPVADRKAVRRSPGVSKSGRAGLTAWVTAIVVSRREQHA